METYSYQEVLVYAKNVKERYPEIKADEMKKALEAKFVGGKDVLQLATVGCICTPFSDYLALLSIVFNSIHKLFAQEKQKLVKLQENIDRAISELLIVR